METVTSGGLKSFATRIPVQAGDRIGLRFGDAVAVRCSHQGALGDSFFMKGGAEPAPGDSISYDPDLDRFDDYRINVAATVEPDADADGFGDESQDACPGAPGEFDGCATPPPTGGDPGAPSGDTTPPDTTITEGPSGKVKSKSATFGFSGSDARAVASFQCKLDSGSFETCTSPKAYSGLKKGSHTFSVRAVDAAGNVDPTPASRTWTVKKKKKKKK